MSWRNEAWTLLKHSFPNTAYFDPSMSQNWRNPAKIAMNWRNFRRNHRINLWRRNRPLEKFMKQFKIYFSKHLFRNPWRYRRKSPQLITGGNPRYIPGGIPEGNLWGSSQMEKCLENFLNALLEKSKDDLLKNHWKKTLKKSQEEFLKLSQVHPQKRTFLVRPG